MQLQNRSGHLRINGAEESLFHDFLFGGAVSNQQHLLCLHNGQHSHGDGGLWHLVLVGEETGIGLNGGLVQLYLVGGGGEIGIRLVKADMTVQTDTQQLQINTAQFFDHSVIGLTLSL